MKLTEDQLTRVRDAATRKGLHPMTMGPSVDGFILWRALRGEELQLWEIRHLEDMLEIHLETD